ncbi:manganese-dependent ADP-ribose/CDP-alcohol diphosphatase [Typha latifolia]|uniref:manganese-dependent ADP-ribose/CDP-alcohol diphosphatase n=1 Tax=Typha latifolia TaxID=4733 RepID=UPI003C2EA75F
MMNPANGLANAHAKEPIFSFGVIADVQYADIPDGRSFLGVPRYYRHSFLVLQRAVRKWNEEKKLKFSINFGDIVDGFCPKDKSLITVEKVVKEFEKFNGPVYHMIGNHCLYNLPRSKLISLFKIPSNDCRAYYDFSPCPEYRFIVLDAYDFSGLGWPQDHPITMEAIKFLQEKNPNTDKNSPNGLQGLERRFLLFNGAVGKKQLNWLEDILRDCVKHQQMAIICCHLPLDAEAAAPEALLWNYEEVMAVVHRYNCVKACFSGHDHKGGYSIDSHGIHHRVLEAALECPPGSNSFGYVDVYHDRLSLLGFDRMVTTEMIFSS